jgi:hypothetical protein
VSYLASDAASFVTGESIHASAVQHGVLTRMRSGRAERASLRSGAPTDEMRAKRLQVMINGGTVMD